MRGEQALHPRREHVVEGRTEVHVHDVGTGRVDPTQVVAHQLDAVPHAGPVGRAPRTGDRVLDVLHADRGRTEVPGGGTTPRP